MVYWQWTNRGFFSEFNLYLLAEYYYSNLNGIDFVCDFSKSNIGHKNLNAYFDISVNDFELPIYKNISPYGRQKFKIYFIDELVKLCLGKKFIPHHKAFNYIWSKDFEGQLFEISSFNELSNFFKSKWSFSDEMKKIFPVWLGKLALDDKYVSFHVRRGDKLKKEAKEESIGKYISFVNLDEVNCVYISTDDYSVIKEFKKLLPSRINIRYSCSPENKGHQQKEFNSLSELEKITEIQKLLFEVEVLRRSEVFVGSLTSNIGVALYLLRSGINSYSVDSKFTLYHNPYVKI